MGCASMPMLVFRAPRGYQHVKTFKAISNVKLQMTNDFVLQSAITNLRSKIEKASREFTREVFYLCFIPASLYIVHYTLYIDNNSFYCSIEIRILFFHIYLY